VKFVLRLILLLFLINTTGVYAQSNMFKQKKERKKVWRHWRRNREAYNPYLTKKARNKPSARLAREEKREMKRQKRKFRRDLRRAGRGHSKGPKP
jgi:hypothetical protein